MIVFGVGCGQFIDQAVSLLAWDKVTVEIKERLELDGFLFFFDVGEDALEDVRAVIGSHVDPDGNILDVGKEAVTLDETHF